MSNDRLATLRHAEALAGRGRLDEAIAEYRRLLDAYPRDWNTTNLLGDLLVKSGEVAAAVALFTRAAEILAVEGFAARACALYKKILKLQPGSDQALMQAGELSARQGLVADARAFFDAAAAGRRQRGEARGALEVRVRLGALDPGDVPGRIDAAGARLELGDRAGALHDLTDFGLSLLEQGRGVDARAVLGEVVTLDPANTTVAYLVELLAAGRVEDALAIINGTAMLDTLEVVMEEDEAPSLEACEPPDAEPVIYDEPAREAAPSNAAPSSAVPANAAPSNAAPSAANIEDLFDRLRREAAGASDDGAAQMALVRGLAFLDAGDVHGGIEQLRTAARSRRYRYAAAVRLARTFEACRQPADAIEWLTHALDAPGLGDGERSETLLHLSLLLERQGETARALATCLELQAHAGDYGDVDQRIARLTRAEAGG